MGDSHKTRLDVLGIRPTSIGLGTGALGVLYTAIADDEALAIVQAAGTAGIGVFDTAPLYGGGLAELRLGRALREFPREAFILCTKVGRTRGFGQPAPPPGVTSDAVDYRYDAILRSVEASLARLGVSRLDIVHIHNPDGRIDEASEGAYRALRRLREEGVVQAIGAGCDSEKILNDILRRVELDCVLLAGRYTLLDQSGMQEVLPFCQQKGIAVMLGGVFNSGILATGPEGNATFNYRPAPEAVLARGRAIQAVCRRRGVPLKAAALQFPLGHPAVTTMLLGPRAVRELEEDMALLVHRIPSGFWAELRETSLIHPDAPVPETTFTGADTVG